jgi:uncharacterized HAD superfamily protein
MKIGLDFDGVISDSTEVKLSLAKELFGVVLQPHQWRKDIVVGQSLLTPEQYNHIQELVYGSDEHGYKMTPIAGASESIRALLRGGHHLTIVTSRVLHKLEIAEAWARTHDIDIAIPFIGAGKNKSKAPYLEGFDIFVDDSLEKLLNIVDVVKHSFLFDQPYNSGLVTPPNISRAHGWPDLMEKIQRATS